MNLNLSKSELNLLLSQLQQKLSDLNTNGADQIKAVDLSDNTAQNVFKNQQKSTSMFNLDLIDNNSNNHSNSKLHLFHNPSKVANGKSLGNLIQEEFDQNEIFGHKNSMSSFSRNTQTNAISSNNSAQNANFQPRSYRRFVHNANPNFSIESFLNKKQQALEYREQLDKQVEEKQRKLQQLLMLEKMKEAMLDKKINEQQKHLKEEFEADHHFDKDHLKDRAIIESNIITSKTESLPMISNTKHSATNHKSSNPILQEKSQNKKLTNTGTITHSNNQKLIVSNLNNKIPNVNSSTASHSTSSCRNVCTQTDDSLLFDLIHDFMSGETMHRNVLASSVKRTAKTTNKSMPPIQVKNTARSTNSTHPSNSKPSVYRKK